MLVRFFFVELAVVFACSLLLLPAVKAGDRTADEIVVTPELSVEPIAQDSCTNESTMRWDKPKTSQTYSEFIVAGRNLADYGFVEVDSSVKNESEPFDLYEDFDIGDQIKGDETFNELLAYRQALKRPSLSFYVDKVERKRWLPSQGFDQPKQYFNAYKSELTTTQDLKDETEAILKQLPNETDYVAKPSHQSTGYGTWIVGYNNDTGVARTSRHARELDEEEIPVQRVAEDVAAGLAKSVNEAAPVFESWALFNVRPGLIIEERFSNVECEDCTPAEFNVFTIWGRVWLAKYQTETEDGMFFGFIHRNGTMADDSPEDGYPDYVDFSRLVKMAETLGANKDMFRTDVFVGVPSGTVKKGATLEERLAAVRYAISECEIFPTTRFESIDDTTRPMEDEAARLWIAGYKMGNYQTVPNMEVPIEFMESGGRLSDHDDFEPVFWEGASDEEEDDEYEEYDYDEDDEGMCEAEEL